jgi:hypothetical protein
MYADNTMQQKTAAGLIAFAAEVVKSSKIIQEIEALKKIKKDLDEGKQDLKELSSFSFAYLIDCVRISIFFENYMKAELIVRGYCIHKINQVDESLKPLISLQKKRPISLEELNKVSAFHVDSTKKKITNKALNNQTIGLSILLKTEYLKCYEFDEEIFKFLKKIQETRNTLHMYQSIVFNVSSELIETIEKVDAFIDEAVKRIK